MRTRLQALEMPQAIDDRSMILCVCVCVCFFYDFVFLLLIGWENDAGFLNQSQYVAIRNQSYYEIITKINSLGILVAKNGKNRNWLKEKSFSWRR